MSRSLLIYYLCLKIKKKKNFFAFLVFSYEKFIIIDFEASVRPFHVLHDLSQVQLLL